MPAKLFSHSTEDHKRCEQRLGFYITKYCGTMYISINTEFENTRLQKENLELKRSLVKLKDKICKLEEEKVQLEKSGIEKEEKMCELEKERVYSRVIYLEAEEKRIELEKEMEERR